MSDVKILAPNFHPFPSCISTVFVALMSLSRMKNLWHTFHRKPISFFFQTPKQVAPVIFQESVISNMNPPEKMEENENNWIYMRSSFSLLQNVIRTTFNTIFTERFFFCFTFFGKRFSTSSSTFTYLTLLLCYNCFVKRSFHLIIC